MASKIPNPELEVEHLRHTLHGVKISLSPRSQLHPLPCPIFPSKFPIELQLAIFENCTLSSALTLSQTSGSLRRTFKAFKQTIVGKILQELGCKNEGDQLQQALLHAGTLYHAPNKISVNNSRIKARHLRFPRHHHRANDPMAPENNMPR